MLNWTRMDDHRKPGGELDWDAYRRAQLANGELCSRCEAVILFGAGHLQECVPCKHRGDPAEFDHDRLIRCPKCRHTWDAIDEELPNNDTMSVFCPECDHGFEVGIHTHYSYTSPAMGESEGE